MFASVLNTADLGIAHAALLTSKLELAMEEGIGCMTDLVKETNDVNQELNEAMRSIAVQSREAQKIA